MFLRRQKQSDTYAAVDLGSNSFHMIVGRFENGELSIIDRLRDMVQLSENFDEEKLISDAAQQRALSCLQRFGQRLKDLPDANVRVVGTNTLRSARNAQPFLENAMQALGYPIEIISGMEEARLIYLGVSRSVAGNKNEKRLVMDIGGGSTEVIIGEGDTPMCMESLYMGCVSMTQRYFQNGVITAESMRRAEIAARVELEPIYSLFREVGWKNAIGASGTIRAVNQVMKENGLSDVGITQEALKTLVKKLVDAKHVDKIKLKGVSSERAKIFPGGVAVLYGAFRALDIQHMEVSDYALREGLIYDLLGRIQHTDIRAISISNIATRFRVDEQQSKSVAKVASYCIDQIANDWNLDEYSTKQWLQWAAQTHEIGLNIAHAHYHKHGAYIIENADLSGFSRQEQIVLSFLIRAQRRKFPKPIFKMLPNEIADEIQKIALVFRFAVLMNRSRSHAAHPEFQMTVDKKLIKIKFPPTWLDDHPLTQADLEQEAAFLKSIDVKLEFE